MNDFLPPRPRCYNSGPISGTGYLEAYERFRRNDGHILSRYGMNPVNPMLLGLRPSRPYWMHILYDLWLMLRCDAVCFQRGWEKSRGARIEYRVARLLRLKVLLPDDSGERKRHPIKKE